MAIGEERLVTTAAEAIANIDRYQEDIGENAGLQGIMSYARAWHGYLAANGTWRVAPSKFVGYAENDASTYLASHRDRDGRRTERGLAPYSEKAEPGTAAYEDLLAAVNGLFARYGRAPNRLIHLHVLKVPRASSGDVSRSISRSALLGRITVNSTICSGRPTIRGMRIRVSDILDLLASGATRKEILADYPYVENEDIDAALLYASESVDHRVLDVA